MGIVNKKATFDYALLDRFEAGVSLLGMEVKSIKTGHASLDGSFVRIIDGEAFLINAQIFAYEYARPDHYDPKRTRKLLLHKKELLQLQTKLNGSNLTVVPVSWYNKGPRIKLEIALAKGKKQFEKRDSKKKEILRRELDREFRGKVK
jgi:SsrA-binding protein